MIAVTRELPEIEGSIDNPINGRRAFSGFDVGPFFVHHSLSDDETTSLRNSRDDFDEWHVTHRASGLAASKSIPTHARAIWLAKKLSELDVWHGTTSDEVMASIQPDAMAAIRVLLVDARSGDCQGAMQ